MRDRDDADEIHADDAGFVRAPVRLTYPLLTDVGGWPAWWPGVRTARMGDVRRPGTDDLHERWAVELRLRRRRAMRLQVVPHTYRHDAGFVLDLSGDLDGRAEFWLETREDGTVVHHVLAATPRRGHPLRVLRAYRQVVRRGLWGCKDHLQSQVRREAGLTP